MKTIAVVLTRYKDPLSQLVYFLNGGGYTHVSLSLDEDMATMYSFNFKGFARETAAKFRRHGVHTAKSYLLQVSDRAYAQLEERIRQFEAHRQQYRYSLLGVFCCYFHIPYKAEGRYFCSQFVAESLASARAVPLRRKPALYLPNQLMRELSRSLQLRRVQYNVL